MKDYLKYIQVYVSIKINLKIISTNFQNDVYPNSFDLQI